jgi:hypothetical protein
MNTLTSNSAPNDHISEVVAQLQDAMATTSRLTCPGCVRRDHFLRVLREQMWNIKADVDRLAEAMLSLHKKLSLCGLEGEDMKDVRDRVRGISALRRCIAALDGVLDTYFGAISQGQVEEASPLGDEDR